MQSTEKGYSMKYRIDEVYGNVYEYDETAHAFIFYAKIIALTDEEMNEIKANAE